MLSIKFVRENKDVVKASEKRRDHDPKVVDQVLSSDESWRSEKTKLQDLQKERNTVSEEINKLMKQKKKDEAQVKIKEMKQLVEDLKAQEEKTNTLKKERDTLLKQIGNVLEDSVPKGKSEDDNPTIKEVGKKPVFNFPIKDHQEIMEDLDLADLDVAAKVSSARFYYLKNDLVLLDLALQRFAIDLLREKGFNLIYPPFMLNRAALAGGVNLSEFQDTIYKIEDEDLYLIGTSEHPLVALKQDVLMKEKELPLKLCGISACFRKEAGSHGRDTKGIFRVHQFNKIEEIIYCKPEDSKEYFQYAQALSEEIFTKLGIPFRVVQICTGDIGNKQSLQYDIEGWFPGQNEKKGAYRELTSCSNCTDYQSVTLNTKFLPKGKASSEKEYVHIINNTAIATARAMVAILENFQTKEGTVKVPKVLWPYMSGVKEIGKK
ncbi:serine--tRNA ligase [archaeon]|nr:serine--tRNA ligase [archaeon]